MMISLRHRYLFLTSICLFFAFAAYHLRYGISASPADHKDENPPKPTRHPKYKPQTPVRNPPIIDNFPLAAAAHSAAELPPVPAWNQPPRDHVPEKTPLFIGFTRNWRILQQAVVSYITAGWPPGDIYVVENTGVMNSNKDGLLSLQNPFFLNHTRLELLGVNVLITPTLLTFAQLQNFYLWTANQQKYEHYFWSHMDVVALSFEDRYVSTPEVSMGKSKPNFDTFMSIYDYGIEALRSATAKDPTTGVVTPWALRFFSYDRLALVNVAAYMAVGGWDTMIPFYMGDCDMHSRLTFGGFNIEDKPAGLVYDVASSLDDIEVLYRKKGAKDASFIDPNQVEEEIAKENEKLKNTAVAERAIEKPESAPRAGTSKDKHEDWHGEDDNIASDKFKQLLNVLDHMQNSKNGAPRGRNTWQARQIGGQGDPFYRDSEGFDLAIGMTIEHGRAVFREKWGHRDCDLPDVGLKAEDAWRVEHDWD